MFGITIRKALLVIVAYLVVAPTQLLAQNNSIWHQRTGAPLTMADTNLIRSLPMEPSIIRLRDKVSVRVDELARTQSEGNAEQRKNLSYNASILDWIRLNGFRSAEPTQGDGVDPTIQAQLQQLSRAESDIETTERLTFNIAAEVVDIRPNGHLVLEASKTIQVNEEVWLVTLAGRCRPEDVGLDNVILSRDLLDLRITKRETGQVRDGYRRGWLHRFLDQLHPF